MNVVVLCLTVKTVFRCPVDVALIVMQYKRRPIIEVLEGTPVVNVCVFFERTFSSVFCKRVSYIS